MIDLYDTEMRTYGYEPCDSGCVEVAWVGDRGILFFFVGTFYHLVFGNRFPQRQTENYSMNHQIQALWISWCS